MGELINIVTPLHRATSRDYLGRMMDSKVECMKISKRYDYNYWDGERRFGYGGYRYIPGRWKPVAEALIDRYNLDNNSSVLDIGCGKGFLLYEFLQILPGLTISGIDISSHGLASAPDIVRQFLQSHSAQDRLPFEDDQFDLVISLGTFHNLRLFELAVALKEKERVGKEGYLMLESYRNEQELFNLQCWALTAESFLDVEEWVWLYQHFGYTGDYEFIFFE
ncbi:class I SAM-dependent methyltransferase [Arenicellales bacterium IMCC57338]